MKTEIRGILREKFFSLAKNRVLGYWIDDFVELKERNNDTASMVDIEHYISIIEIKRDFQHHCEHYCETFIDDACSEINYLFKNYNSKLLKFYITLFSSTALFVVSIIVKCSIEIHECLIKGGIIPHSLEFIIVSGIVLFIGLIAGLFIALFRSN